MRSCGSDNAAVSHRPLSRVPTDLLADSKPFLIGTDLCLLLCQLRTTVSALTQKHFSPSLPAWISLKIIRINIHTDDFGILSQTHEP